MASEIDEGGAGAVGAGRKGSVVAERFAGGRGAATRRGAASMASRFPTNEEVVKAVQGKVEVRGRRASTAASARAARHRLAAPAPAVGWAGLGWAGLGWAGLGWAGLG
jgi:hypothetical protein